MPTIREDAPHPDSYRPDLPLRSEVEHWGVERGYDEGFEEGHSKGYDEGVESGHSDGVDEATTQLAQKVEPLVAQLADIESKVRDVQTRSQLAAVETKIRELRSNLADVA
jgi:flagellar biosynthesis/type III secretory pathway protein FliH